MARKVVAIENPGKTQRVDRVLHLLEQLKPGWYHYKDIQAALAELYPALDAAVEMTVKSAKGSVWNVLNTSGQVAHGEHGSGLWRLKSWRKVPEGPASVTAFDQVQSAQENVSSPRYWWVNQKHYKSRWPLKCLWAELRGSRGQRVPHWESLSEARIGDVVFCYADAAIRAVAHVVAAPVKSRYPIGDNKALGWKVAVEYDPLATPIPKSSLYGQPGLPFNVSGRADQKYFVPLDDEAGQFLMGLTGTPGDVQQRKYEPTLLELGFRVIDVELIGVDCIYRSKDKRATMADVRNKLCEYTGLSEMPKRTLGPINDAVNKSHKRRGFIKPCEGYNVGWALTDEGTTVAKRLNSLMKSRPCHGDDVVRWLRDIHSEALSAQKWAELDSTTREALIASRVGQGKFRTDVIKRWGGTCCVTGAASVELLRASHILPWADATDDQRLDPHNGLLLSPTYDAAFDRGYISFEDDGRIVLSPMLDSSDAERLGLSGKVRIKKLSPENRWYLEYHRNSVLRKEKVVLSDD